ncbi:MAG: hypothetical protein RIQ52_1289, partial [Pseudomonadota bacterium]
LPALRQRYADGIGWGEMKQFLFEYLNEHLQAPRERFEALMQAPDHIEMELRRGAERAGAIAEARLARIRKSVGIR